MKSQVFHHDCHDFLSFHDFHAAQGLGFRGSAVSGFPGTLKALSSPAFRSATLAERSAASRPSSGVGSRGLGAKGFRV